MIRVIVVVLLVAAALAGCASDPTQGYSTASIYPAGVYTHLLSSKHNAILTSPRFPIETDAISVRLLGGDYAQARLVVESYPLPRGGIYGMKVQLNRDEMDWATWDVSFWKGYRGYIELATFDDLTFVGGYDKRRKAPNREDGRSYFGISDILFHARTQDRPKEQVVPLRALFGTDPPPNADALAERYRNVLGKAIAAWYAHAPKWRPLNAVTEPMPYCFARSMAMFMAYGPITSPWPPSESRVTVAGISRTIRGFGSGLIPPSPNDSTYLRNILLTPCVSMPRTSA